MQAVTTLMDTVFHCRQVEIRVMRGMRHTYHSRAGFLLHICLLVNAARGSLHQPSYQRPVTDDELHSPITRSIDKSFSRFAEEVQSDKSNRGSSYHYIYSEPILFFRWLRKKITVILRLLTICSSNLLLKQDMNVIDMLLCRQVLVLSEERAHAIAGDWDGMQLA